MSAKSFGARATQDAEDDDGEVVKITLLAPDPPHCVTFISCHREGEMITELGTDTGTFCQCLWEGIGDLGVSRSDRLQVVETWVEGETPQVDLVVENCAFNAFLGG